MARVRAIGRKTEAGMTLILAAIFSLGVFAGFALLAVVLAFYG